MANDASSILPSASDTSALSAGFARAMASAPWTPGAGLVQKQGDFAGVLGRAKDGSGQPSNQTPEQRARAAAEDFVAIALVQPILKQLRDSNQTPPPFGPGEGEKALGGLADAEIAKNLVRRGGFGVVGVIEKQMLSRLKSEAQLATAAVGNER